MQAQPCAGYGQPRRQPVPTSFAPQLQGASNSCVGHTSAGPVEGQHSPATLLAAQTAAYKEGQLAEQRAYAHFLAGDRDNYYAGLALSTRQAALSSDPRVALPQQLPQQCLVSHTSYTTEAQGLNPRYSATRFGPPPAHPLVCSDQAAGAPHAQGSMPAGNSQFQEQLPGHRLPFSAVGGGYHLPVSVHRQHTRSHGGSPSPFYEPQSFAGNYMENEHPGPDLPQ